MNTSQIAKKAVNLLQGEINLIETIAKRNDKKTLKQVLSEQRLNFLADMIK